MLNSQPFGWVGQVDSEGFLFPYVSMRVYHQICAFICVLLRGKEAVRGFKIETSAYWFSKISTFVCFVFLLFLFYFFFFFDTF